MENFERIEALSTAKAAVRIYNKTETTPVLFRMSELSIEASNEAIEVSSFPNNGNKEYIYGVEDTTVSGTCYYVNQIAAKSIKDNSLFVVQIYLDYDDTEPYFEQVMFTNKLNEKLNTSDLITFDLEFKTAPTKMLMAQ